ncbi:MAG: hypothetical protein U0234_23140 [Sandaracinus sp.]
MHDETSRGLALGLVFAAVTIAGCNEAHGMPDAARADADAPTDAGSSVAADASTGDDAAVLVADAATVDAAAVDAATVDAAFEDAWADIPDAYYPDGIRG